MTPRWTSLLVGFLVGFVGLQIWRRLGTDPEPTRDHPAVAGARTPRPPGALVPGVGLNEASQRREREELDAFEVALEGSRIAMDGSVPEGVRQESMERILANLDPGIVAVLDLDCSAYPCVLVVEHPPDFAFIQALSSGVSTATGGDYRTSYMQLDRPALVKGEGNVVSVVSVSAPDLPDVVLAERMLAAALEFGDPIDPSSEEAASPLYLGTGWP